MGILKILLIGILIIVVLYIVLIFVAADWLENLIGMMFSGSANKYKFVGNYNDRSSRAISMIAQGPAQQIFNRVKKDQPQVFALQDGKKNGSSVQLFYDISPNKVGYKKYGISRRKPLKYTFEGKEYQMGAPWTNSVYVRQ